MHVISNNRAPSKIFQLFVCSNMIHSHYTRFSAAGNFYVQKSRLNQLLLSFSRSGVRIWNKIPFTLREQRKDPFKRKLHKLLIKVLETKKVYVDMSTITSSYLNSLFSYKCFSFLITIGATIIYLFHFIFAFSLLTFFCRLYRWQLFHCCPPRITPLSVGDIGLTH